MLQRVDKTLLGIVLVLVIGGFFVFSSASLGLLAREGATFSSVAFNQVVFGIIGGLSAMLIVSQVHYRFWRRYAFYIFLFSVLLTSLVFVPDVGLSYGGAKRWISIAGFSLQPAEVLKVGLVIYLSTWLSGMQQYIKNTWKGTLPFFGIVSLVGVLMLAQPDTDTFLIMAAAALAMFLTAGGKWRDIGFVCLAVLVLILVLAAFRPYVKDRIMTFFDPSIDPQGSSYQVRQSLIAIGSGGLQGRGFGQSIQKFEYLPEPIGDSVFAVFAEEFGFFGSAGLILLLSFFTFRGYKIATHAVDQFGTLLVVGIVTLVVVQAFLNIASMVALAPLGGLPLPFVSHGGTALLVTLASVGIVLNVSKHRKKKI
ncbi:stage V sporulation protein E [bacterium]|nr:stage V sporulation protein E [bacterium]